LKDIITINYLRGTVFASGAFFEAIGDTLGVDKASVKGYS
jgi:hypothetical protein